MISLASAVTLCAGMWILQLLHVYLILLSRFNVLIGAHARTEKHEPLCFLHQARLLQNGKETNALPNGVARACVAHTAQQKSQMDALGSLGFLGGATCAYLEMEIPLLSFPVHSSCQDDFKAQETDDITWLSAVFMMSMPVSTRRTGGRCKN